MIYRWQTGAIAWLLHRLSGLALTFYLTLHIWVIHNLTGGPEQFNKVMEFVATPLFKLLEIGLLGTVLYHTFNGIRILFVDFGRGSRYHKKLFWIMIIIAGGLFAVGGLPLFLDLLAVLPR